MQISLGPHLQTLDIIISEKRKSVLEMMQLCLYTAYPRHSPCLWKTCRCLYVRMPALQIHESSSSSSLLFIFLLCFPFLHQTFQIHLHNHYHQLPHLHSIRDNIRIKSIYCHQIALFNDLLRCYNSLTASYLLRVVPLMSKYDFSTGKLNIILQKCFSTIYGCSASECPRYASI